MADISKGKFLSFAEIIQGRDHIVKVSDDGLLYAVDLVMVMTGKNRDMAGNVLRRLPEELFKSSKFIERRSARGGRPIKLINFHDAIELVMVLPGKKAKKVKTEFASIIRRYLAGDQTLILEINCNDATKSAVGRLAKESIRAGIKHRREEDDDDALIGYENFTLARQMAFVEKAFKFQETALGVMEHENTTEKNVGRMADMIIKKEKDLLLEIRAAKELDQQLDSEIQGIKREYLEIKSQFLEKVETIRILSELRIETDCVE